LLLKKGGRKRWSLTAADNVIDCLVTGNSPLLVGKRGWLSVFLSFRRLEKERGIFKPSYFLSCSKQLSHHEQTS